MSSRHARRISTPLPYLGKLTLSAGVITDDTRLAGVEGDGKAYPDSSAGVWPAATNLCTNGNATTNTTGWSASGGTVSRITTDHFFGSTCFEFAPSGLNDASTFSKLVSGSTTYTISCWFKSPDLDIGFVVEEYDSGDGYLTGVYPTLTCAANERTYATITFTTNASTAYIVFGPQATESTGAIKFGGVQLEAGSIATPYIETDGGTASRVAGRIQGPASVLDETQGWVFVRTLMKHSSAALPSTYVGFWEWGDDTNNRFVAYYDGALKMFRRTAAGFGTIPAAAGSYANGDYISAGFQWNATTQKTSFNGGTWASGANTTIPVLAATQWDISDTPVAAGSAGLRTLHGNDIWVAAGRGLLTDVDADLFDAWGNNRPLPHIFPQSADVRFLAHFYSDGTQYRWSAA